MIRDIIDETDRATLEAAAKFGFDKDGFDKGDPLRKNVFFTNPYVTCSWCNFITYIDVKGIRLTLATDTTVDDVRHFRPIYANEVKERNSLVQNTPKVNFPSSPPAYGMLKVLPKKKIDLEPNRGVPFKCEGIPACRRCHRGDGFVIGAHDFTVLIEHKAQIVEERLRREDTAARVIQRSYGCYLRRTYATAMYRARMVRKRLYYVAATAINRIMRGRFARRRFATEKKLLVIKQAHPAILSYALYKWPEPNAPSVFWYKRKGEVKLLYEDYILLCARSGFQPPLIIVEKNIAEICRRILGRGFVLVQKIQKIWRGVMCRRVVVFFKSEFVRLHQRLHALIMKIQRLFRGYLTRKRVFRIRAGLAREQVMQKYLDDVQASRNSVQKMKDNYRIKALYCKEKAEAYTAWATGKLDDAMKDEYAGKKTFVFAASCYSDDSVKLAMQDFVYEEKITVSHDDSHDQAEKDRKVFILNKLKQLGHASLGSRTMNSVEIAENEQKYEALRAKMEAKNHERLMRRKYIPNPDDDDEDDEGRPIIRRAAGNSPKSPKHERTDKILLGFQFGVKEPSRIAGTRAYFAEELKDLTEKTITRMQHTFTHNNLLERFREYNENKVMDKKPIVKNHRESLRRRMSNALGVEASRLSSDELGSSPSSPNLSPNRRLAEIDSPTLTAAAARQKKKNILARGANRKFKNTGYKYPAGINSNPMDWLMGSEDMY